MLDENPPVPSDQPEVSMEPAAVAAAAADAPQRLHINTDDVLKYGYTPGCGGCNSIRLGKTRCGHNDKCRLRISKAMCSSTAVGWKRAEDARHRESEYLSGTVQKEDEERQARLARRSAVGNASSSSGNGVQEASGLTAPRGAGTTLAMRAPVTVSTNEGC